MNEHRARRDRDRGPGTTFRRAASGLSWTALEQWGARILSTVVLVGLARILEPQAFGLIALALVVVAVGEAVVQFGISQALVQHPALEDRHVDTAFALGVGFGLVSTVALFVAAPSLAGLLGDVRVAGVLRWFAPTLILTGAAVAPEGVLLRHMRFRPLAVRRLVATVVGGGAAIVVALSGGGVAALVTQVVVTKATMVVVLFVAVDRRPRPAWDLRAARDLAGFGKHLLGAQLLTLASTRADDLLIGVVLGPRQLGVYTVAYRLIENGTQLFIGVINQVALPVLSRIQNQPREVRRTVYDFARALTGLGAPAFLGLGLVAPEVVATVFGPTWQGAVPVMRILALVGCIRAIGAVRGPAMIAAGRPGLNTAIVGINAIGNVLVFVLAVRYGIVAVAGGYALRAYLLFPLSFWGLMVATGIGVRAFMRHVSAPLLATAGMICTVAAFRSLPVTDAVLIAGDLAVGGLSYLMLLRLVAPDLLPWRLVSPSRYDSRGTVS